MNEFETKGIHSTERRVLNRVTNTSCELAIFYDSHDQIKALCEYRITLNDTQATITWLHQNKYVLTNIKTYVQHCTDHVPVLHEGCTWCLISVAANCFIKSDGIFTTRILANEPTRQSVIKYPINRPQLNHLFLPSELAHIAGDTLMDSQPS